jgi:uncharacterized membrane protein YsdA (DUF1294 family)
MILGAALFLMVINVTAFFAFVYDKACAVRGDRRVPESNLLMLAFIGGSLGAVSAQQIVRHKTRKEPFRSYLFAIVALHVGALSFLIVLGPEAAWNMASDFIDRTLRL